MQNVREEQLRNCIFFFFKEFRDVLKKLGILAHLGKYSITYSDLGGEKQIEDEDAYKALSEYLDVEVTSVHIDQKDETGVWIAYNERAKNSLFLSHIFFEGDAEK